ncbi:MAG: hypothetical protein R3A46_17730 [Thermomicrobiales bacterium]
MTPEEPQGGDVEPADLAALVKRAEDRRVAWNASSQDLNVNLIVLHAGERVDAHRNDEVDVLIVGIEGSGEISVDASAFRITPGTAVVVPRGASRSIRAAESRFAYLTCHRRRKELWPEPPARRSRRGS